MLVDTSAWLDYLYYNRNKKICDFLDKYLQGSDPVFCTPIVYQEVLQGVRKDQDFQDLRTDFLTYKFVQFNNQLLAAEQAAEIYRGCRKKGLTIRKAQDCLIALTCIKFDLELLHNDKDFDNIAKVYPLKVISA